MQFDAAGVLGALSYFNLFYVINKIICFITFEGVPIKKTMFSFGEGTC
jgi:hypothetical protein